MCLIVEIYNKRKGMILKPLVNFLMFVVCNTKPFRGMNGFF